MTSDTIAALATARGPGALAVVRLSGPEAISIADRVFRPAGKIAGLASHACAVGHLVDGEEKVDQVVAAVFRQPHSFTGENAVEFTCHGGFLIPSRILQILHHTGARPARPGEFTLRAFLNGRIDLSQAEAVAALIGARSVAAARLAMRVLEGGLRTVLDESMERLAEALALIEANLDIQEDGAPDVLATLPEWAEREKAASAAADEVASAPGASAAARAPAGSPGPVPHEPSALGTILEAEENRLGRLLAGGWSGRLLEEGVRIALAGRTNAGKSSLFNAFLARDRAIVSTEPGTTRDFLEGWVEWEGLPVVLIDTAGLSPSASSVEQEGVRRTRRAVASAVVTVLVVDVSSVDPGKLDEELAELQANDSHVVIALHKWDLAPGTEWVPRSAAEESRAPARKTGAGEPGAEIPETLPPQLTQQVSGRSAVAMVPSSVVGDAGIERLKRVIIERIVAEVGDADSALVVGERQRQLLADAHGAVGRARALLEEGAGGEFVAFELQRALEPLGEILGKRAGPMVLDRIFARFCVGK
jgi:tRNA modification GTPase